MKRPADTGQDFARTLTKLLRLLRMEERSRFARACGLDRDALEQGIGDAVADLPRYELVRLFILTAVPTLRMISDIFSTLECLGVAIRTTGCVFILADPTAAENRTELAFSQQSIGALSN